MEKIYTNLPDFTIYTKQNICDNTKFRRRAAGDAVSLTMGDTPTRPSCRVVPPANSTSSQQNFLSQVLLYTDLPSLTRFRRVNRRAMELVDSVPQYGEMDV